MQQEAVAIVSAEEKSEEAKKSKAREIYFESPILPSIERIARSVGVHHKKISRWRNEGNWELLRHEQFIEKAKDLEAKGCDERSSIVETLEICKTMKADIKRRIGDSGTLDASGMLKLAGALSKVADIEKESFRRMKAYQ